MTFQEKFLNQIDQQIEEQHLLKHPFYQAWSKGTLEKECLKEYAKEYYHHVRAFPTYLSALHSHTEEGETRKEILKNLVEEEAGTPNHPDLWKQFALSLGATEEEIANHQPCGEICSLIATFKEICLEKSVAEGIASLYAYESQIPAICLSKIEGLKTYYGMADPNEWVYFTVHISADEEHAAVERKLLGRYVDSDCADVVTQSVARILERLNSFLSGLCHRFQIA